MSWRLHIHTLDRGPRGEDQAVRVRTTQTWHWAGFAAILLLAAFLNFFHLGLQGRDNAYNLYYAATVRSMLTSPHNFWFASFDPGGFVTVDKPPLGFWIQALSVLVFGWSGLSLLVPQALAGIGSVAVLFQLVRRVFGPLPGLIAALALAITPISVAANRNNTIDSLLLLTLLIAIWALCRATETGRLHLLVTSALLIGLGFNIKMLQAFLVLPVFYGLYLLGAPVRLGQRVRHLLIASVVLAAVSLIWTVAVDLTPPTDRPFIGGSEDNTVVHLILGHNGASRLLPAPLEHHITDEIDFPGPFRLFERELGPQIGWLLPLAAFGLAAGWRPQRRQFANRQQQALLLWALWLMPQIVLFSFGHKFHRYYLTMMAPAIAALVGIGVVCLWHSFFTRGWRAWVLPLAVLATAANQLHLVAYFPTLSVELVPWIVGGLAVMLVIARVRVRGLLHSRRWTRSIALASFSVLLAAPAVWSSTLLWGADPQYPYAGPELSDRPLTVNDMPDMQSLVEFLQHNDYHERFLVATLTAKTAAPLILTTGKPVLTLGGYSGGDPILTVAQVAARTQRGDVRFYLLPTQAAENAEMAWVATHCAQVDPTRWAEDSSHSYLGEPYQLFDCASVRHVSHDHVPSL